MQLLESEPPSAPVITTGPDIPAPREQPVIRVFTDKAKEPVSVQLTHEQVRRLSYYDE